MGVERASGHDRGRTNTGTERRQGPPRVEGPVRDRERGVPSTVAWLCEEVGELDDRALSALRAWRIGFVFQQFHLASGVTALDNVADGLLYCGLPRRERRRLPCADAIRSRDHRRHGRDRMT